MLRQEAGCCEERSEEGGEFNWIEAAFDLNVGLTRLMGCSKIKGSGNGFKMTSFWWNVYR